MPGCGVRMDPGERKVNMEREVLRGVIAQWNANRLDLFELSEPNEDLEFHGVMRFYYQDSGQKVSTKCIRVASTATAHTVIKTLIEKFRPDMRMLTISEYALYEIHENGEERQLGDEEKPLLVQLNWHHDDREGRFLLRRLGDKTQMPETSIQEEGSFKRKLSKREKKQLKKQEKLQRMKSMNTENDRTVAEKLYTELPETSFTRSISNPEAVMRRRRQQKLEKKLQQFRSRDGGPDTGGTLKIYGESLCKDVPYKTLLLSVRDTAAQVVREMLDKYGMDKEDPVNYCLVQVNYVEPDSGDSKEFSSGPNREYILEDEECPLAILMNHPPFRGSIMFHVRRRPADSHPRKRKKKPKQAKPNDLEGSRHDEAYERLPFLLELNPDGSDITQGVPKKHKLQLNVTEVGNERSAQTGGQLLQLFGPNVQPRHCVIAHTEGIVTVTPCSRDAETHVNEQRIYETTILQHGAVVRFGLIHSFQFLDPMQDERGRHRHDSARQLQDGSFDRQTSKDDPTVHAGSQNYETTFDVDGNIETVSTAGSQKDETRSQRSVGSKEGSRSGNYERVPRGGDAILPAALDFREDTEDAFLHAVITDFDATSLPFKLAPTYTLYLAARFRASTNYRPELTPNERAVKLTAMLSKVARITQHVIQTKFADSCSLAFWMSNASELLHFLKADRHIFAFSLDAQDILAEAVQVAFRNLVSCMQVELDTAMPEFMMDRDDQTEEEGTSQQVLTVLCNSLALLRRCRVNPVLTIQLFSQLFHFINLWVFNKVVTENHPNFCTRAWGVRLLRRLGRIEIWAEKHGLELAADCHLSRVRQAAQLLQAPKFSADDISPIISACFKLNSLQLKGLLEKYQPAQDEPKIPQDLIKNVVEVAETAADELAKSDGWEIKLTEDMALQLPFLLPEDGYNSDVVRGVPGGLMEFLAPLQHAGLCRLTPQPTSSGYWTVYMYDQDVRSTGARSPSAMSSKSGSDMSRYPARQEPEIQVIKLHKSSSGMGLSIVAAKGAGQDKLGIYIKSVVTGGAAQQDGRLQAGDQLLKVDGQSLVGITQEKAAEYMVRTGPVVALEVAKQGAIYHGLATLLSQPSPVMGRGYHGPGSRRMSERDLPNKVLREHNHDAEARQGLPPQAPRIQSSKSVPSLTSGGNEPIHGSPVGGLKQQQEVYNPGYSRTSSTSSIPQKATEVAAAGASGHPAAMRSRSVQNLSEVHGHPPGANSAVSRQPSNPSWTTSGPAEEERHYQNVSLYQNHNGYPTHSPGTAPQQHAAADERSQQHRMSRGSQSSLQRPPEHAGVRDRPASSYVPRENVPQGQGAHDMHRYPTPQIMPKSQSSRDISRQEAKMHEEFLRFAQRGYGSFPPGQLHPRLRSPVHRVPNTYPPGQGGPPVAHHVVEGHPQQQGFPQHHYPPQGYPLYLQQQGYSPRAQGHSQPGFPAHGHPPHPHGYPQNMLRGPGNPSAVPKPRMQHPHAVEPSKLQRQYLQEGSMGGDSTPIRPPPPNDTAYRESPPPPPPPTSTHPLLQGSRPSQQDLRHNSTPSTPAAETAHGPRGHFNVCSNPWEREEKEKENQRRTEVARHWRDKQISDLEALDSRTYKQDEQLRALWLEREFQRRAEEIPDEDDDEQEEENGSAVDRRVLLRSVQEDLERSRQRRQEKEMVNLSQHHLQQQRLDRSSHPRDEQQQQPDRPCQQRDDQHQRPDRLSRNEQLQEQQGRQNPQCVQSVEGLNQQQSETQERKQQQPQPAQVMETQWKNQQHLPVNGMPASRPQNGHPLNREEEERLRKLDEFRQKQKELEATKEVEARLLREAQRRKEEVLKQQRLAAQTVPPVVSSYSQQLSRNPPQCQSASQSSPSPHFTTAPQQPPCLRPQVDSLVSNGPGPYSGPPTQNGPVNGINISNAYHPEQPPLPNSPPPNSKTGTQRLDTLVSNYTPTQTQSAFMNHPAAHSNQLMVPTSSTQRLDTLVLNYMNDSSQSVVTPHPGLSVNQPMVSPSTAAPVPPERGSSYSVMSQQRLTVPNLKSEQPAKRVSFHDTNITCDSSPDQDKPREDPNAFISEAESLMSSPNSDLVYTTGSTPGVIGAQEVYRDPRTRRLAQQKQERMVTSRTPGPEKLSFKEKMKMFAMESGENNTPKDKVKISRAQREIEEGGSPETSGTNET